MSLVRFGPFALQHRLGIGATAEVWAASGLGHRRLAVKRLLPHHSDDPRLLARFSREKEVLSQLRGRGLPHLIASGSEHGLPWLAMPLLGDVSLDVLLSESDCREREWWPAAATLLVADVAAALARLHAQGFVHGDVTPRNVRIGRDGRAALVDLGLAAALQPDGWTAPQPAWGTPRFRPGGVLEAGRWSSGLDAFSLARTACVCRTAADLVGVSPDCDVLAGLGWAPAAARALQEGWLQARDVGAVARQLRKMLPVGTAGAVRATLGKAVDLLPRPEPPALLAAEHRGEWVTSLDDDPDATAVAG